MNLEDFRTEFYSKMKDFAKKSMKILNTEKDKLTYNLAEERLIKKPTESSLYVSSEFLEKPNFHIFISRHWIMIKKLTEYKDIKIFMEKNKYTKKYLNKPVGTSESRFRTDVDRVLESLLLHLVDQKNGFEFDEGAFKKIYKRIEEFFIESKLKFSSFAPLEGFRCPINEIEIEKGMRIVKVSEERLMDVSKFNYVHMRFNLFNFVLERIYETEKAIGEIIIKPSVKFPSQETKEIFDNVVSALRLFKSGTVGYNFIHTKPISWTPIGGISISSGIFTYPYLGSYNLKKDEIKHFKEFYLKIKKAPEFLKIPIRRFNFASGRERPEDKLIDYVIALESIMLFDEKQEMTYKISLRTAMLLGKNETERKETFNLVKEAYNQRSKIVHGSGYDKNVKINKSVILFQDFVSKVEELVRDSIKLSLAFRDRTSLLKEIGGKIFK